MLDLDAIRHRFNLQQHECHTTITDATPEARDAYHQLLGEDVTDMLALVAKLKEATEYYCGDEAADNSSLAGVMRFYFDAEEGAGDE